MDVIYLYARVLQIPPPRTNNFYSSRPISFFRFFIHLFWNPIFYDSLLKAQREELYHLRMPLLPHCWFSAIHPLPLSFSLHGRRKLIWVTFMHSILRNLWWIFLISISPIEHIVREDILYNFGRYYIVCVYMEIRKISTSILVECSLYLLHDALHYWILSR